MPIRRRDFFALFGSATVAPPVPPRRGALEEHEAIRAAPAAAREKIAEAEGWLRESIQQVEELVIWNQSSPPY